MNRSEFIAATAIILFGAFLLGWFACWLVHRLTRPGREDIAQHGRIAHALHEAEAARDAARETLAARALHGWSLGASGPERSVCGMR